MPPGDRARASSPSDLEIDDDLAAPKPLASSSPPRQYIDLDILRNSDDIVAIISQRRSNGVLTFAIFKEFERDRRPERTSFVAESLIPSYIAMANLVEKRIHEIRSTPNLLAKLQRAAGYDPEPRRTPAAGNGGRR